MKLERWISGAAVALFVSGCSAAPLGPPGKAPAAQPVSDAVAITQLMSAELPGPSPKVGKPQINASDEVDTGDLDAPKDVRREDGSRRSGGFGTTK